MSLEFAVEAYLDVVDEMQLLYAANWAETGHDGDSLDVDYEAFEQAAHSLHVSVARENGVLVGYHAVRLTKSWKQKNTLVGLTSMLYLKRSARKGFNGVKFLKFTENALREAGVNRFITTATTRNPFYRVLEWLGFSELERVYTKVL